jgi:hypothetical protein
MKIKLELSAGPLMASKFFKFSRGSCELKKIGSKTASINILTDDANFPESRW